MLLTALFRCETNHWCHRLPLEERERVVLPGLKKEECGGASTAIGSFRYWPNNRLKKIVLLWFIPLTVSLSSILSDTLVEIFKKPFYAAQSRKDEWIIIIICCRLINPLERATSVRKSPHFSFNCIINTLFKKHSTNFTMSFFLPRNLLKYEKPSSFSLNEPLGFMTQIASKSLINCCWFNHESQFKQASVLTQRDIFKRGFGYTPYARSRTSFKDQRLQGVFMESFYGFISWTRSWIFKVKAVKHKGNDKLYRLFSTNNKGAALLTDYILHDLLVIDKLSPRLTSFQGHNSVLWNR